MDAEVGLYRRVIEGLPDAWIEDPALDDSTAGLLERHRNLITWDEPVRSVSDIEALPSRPVMLKREALPLRQRASGVRHLRLLRHARHRRLWRRDVRAGSGTGQLQYLASLFHADAPNDVAPAGYNLPSPPHDLPHSPVAPEPHPTGFRWGTYDGRRTIREQATAVPAAD